MTKEQKISDRMKTISRDTESLVRALCEALIRIDELENSIRITDTKLREHIHYSEHNKC